MLNGLICQGRILGTLPYPSYFVLEENEVIKIARKTVYNEVYTPELLEQVNKENISLLNDFVDYLNSTDKAELTVYNYISDIRICFIWNLLNNSNKEFVSFTKRDFMKYQNYLINELKVSPNRVRRLRSALSSMSGFIENVLDDEYPNFRNIVNKIPAPVKVEVREKTVLTDEQIEKLLQHLVATKKYQQACYLALACASGARKSELLRFKVDYFKDEHIVWGSFWKTPEKIVTKGRGRLGKPLNKFSMVKVLKPYLDLWLAEREELGIENEWLFVSYRDNEWVQTKVSTVDCWTTSWSKYLNVPIYVHAYRHYWCTQLSRQNLPPSLIKKLQGWESLEMVDLYNDMEVDEELGKYFDENGIKNVEQKGLTDI